MGKPNKEPGKLTEKEAKFCREYMKDFKRTQAVIRAGYSKKNARRIAAALMEKPRITDYLVKLQAEIAEKHDLTVDGIILNLKAIRNTSLHLMSLEVDKTKKADLSLPGDIPSKNFAAVAAVALKANELMGQHIGMWPKKIEIDHNIKEMEQKEAENSRKVFEIVDGFAAKKSDSGKKTLRVARGRKTKTANA